MAAWDIDPGGVAGVVAAARQIGDELDEDGRAIRTELGGAVGAAGSGPVGPAIEAFLSDRGAQLDFVTGRADGCVLAADRAVAAYLAGDEEMAAHAQAAAATASDVHPLLLTMPR